MLLSGKEKEGKSAGINGEGREGGKILRKKEERRRGQEKSGGRQPFLTSSS